MNKKEHLTSEGLNKIVSIKASMNKYLNKWIFKLNYTSISNMKRFVFINLWLEVMSELALLISGKWYTPRTEGGSRVFPRFVRVGWALLISGLGIAVIGALYSGAAATV